MTISTLPANLPEGRDAKLPATYEKAQQALAECTRVDEAWNWQNRAAALAAYARMARDNQLRDMALRIQARAIRRAGELLRQVPPANGANQNICPDGGMKVTRSSAAADAGLSKRQKDTALQVANVPANEFASVVDSDTPPSITQLAALGTDKCPATPEDIQLARKARDLLRDFAAFCGAHDPVRVARVMSDTDSCRGNVETIDAWLDRFVTNLESENEAA
jgi:hypothetical protein